METTIKLHGGFCDGLQIPNVGADRVKIMISRENGDTLIPGFAVYEIDLKRLEGFFLINEWDN